MYIDNHYWLARHGSILWYRGNIAFFTPSFIFSSDLSSSIHHFVWNYKKRIRSFVFSCKKGKLFPFSMIWKNVACGSLSQNLFKFLGPNYSRLLWFIDIQIFFSCPLYCLLFITLTVLLSKSHVTPSWPSYLHTLKQVREKETKEENNIYLNVTI